VAYFAQQIGGAGVTNLPRTPWVHPYTLNAGPSSTGGSGPAPPPTTGQLWPRGK